MSPESTYIHIENCVHWTKSLSRPSLFISVVIFLKSKLTYKSPIAFNLITQVKLIHLLFNSKNNLVKKSNYVVKFTNEFVCFFKFVQKNFFK